MQQMNKDKISKCCKEEVYDLSEDLGVCNSFGGHYSMNRTYCRKCDKICEVLNKDKTEQIREEFILKFDDEKTDPDNLIDELRDKLNN